MKQLLDTIVYSLTPGSKYTGLTRVNVSLSLSGGAGSPFSRTMTISIGPTCGGYLHVEAPAVLSDK